jgi:hypothetical protein
LIQIRKAGPATGLFAVFEPIGKQGCYRTFAVPTPAGPGYLKAGFRTGEAV